MFTFCSGNLLLSKYLKKRFQVAVLCILGFHHKVYVIWYICCGVSPHLVVLLRAIDESARPIDRAAQSSDPSFAHASVDRATIDGSRCAIDR